MSGFFRPAAAKMSTTSSDTTAFEMIWRMAWSSSSSVLRSPGVLLASTARTAWKKPTSSRMRSASSCGHRERERLRQLGDGLQQPLLAVLLREDVLLRRRQQRQALLRRAAWSSGDQSKPWNRPRQISYFSSISATASAWSSAVLPVPPALGVGRQRLLQLVGEAQVVHHQPAGLVLEHAVDARDGLHQPVPAHRLVDVHRVQARRVESGEPHVAHDHDLERVGRGPEALRPAPRGAPCCGCAAATRADRRPSRS